jgi:monolysocardiolipin acyltransferase
MRYFRWGVGRLILESEPLPEIVPIFIDGTHRVMHESREFPRFIPRIGKEIKVVFGDEIDGERVFGDLRRRWRTLVDLQREALRNKGEDDQLELGVLTEGLKHNKEAIELRLEATRRMRNEVVKLRRKLGYPDEDPKNEKAATWVAEGGSPTEPPEKPEGQMKDRSWTKQK